LTYSASASLPTLGDLSRNRSSRPARTDYRPRTSMPTSNDSRAD